MLYVAVIRIFIFSKLHVYGLEDCTQHQFECVLFSFFFAIVSLFSLAICFLIFALLYGSFMIIIWLIESCLHEWRRARAQLELDNEEGL